jgi:hypothetical protein
METREKYQSLYSEINAIEEEVRAQLDEIEKTRYRIASKIFEILWFWDEEESKPFNYLYSESEIADLDANRRFLSYYTSVNPQYDDERLLKESGKLINYAIKNNIFHANDFSTQYFDKYYPLKKETDVI